jgi:hypothetical protein
MTEDNDKEQQQNDLRIYDIGKRGMDSLVSERRPMASSGTKNLTERISPTLFRLTITTINTSLLQ